MDRRKFLRNGSLAGMAITSLSVVSCNTDTEKNADVAKEPTTKASLDFKLNEVTVDELQQKMKTGEYTSRTITEMYLKRIDEVDKNGPTLNSVIELNPDALTIADEMDKERKAGKYLVPSAVQWQMNGIHSQP